MSAVAASLVLASAILGTVRTSLAQPSSDLTREFQAGVDSFRLGKYAEAKDHLEKARKLDPKLPGPHRFLAAVAQATGDWNLCIEAAREALRLNPESGEVGDTRKLHDDCRQSAGRAPFRAEFGDGGAIGVSSNVSGASITIRGLGYGATPLAPRPLAAGEVEILIEKTGWLPVKRTVVVLPLIVTDVQLEMEPDPTASTVSNELGVKPQIAAPTDGFIVVNRGLSALPGFSVLIDGKPTTIDSKNEIVMQPGEYIVEIRATGYDPMLRRARISKGQKRQIAGELVSVAQRERREHRGHLLLAGGTALALGGFTTMLLAKQADAEARDILRIERNRPTTIPLDTTTMIEPLHTRADYEDAQSRAKRWALISNVAYGAAFITTGVSIAYLYLARSERRYAAKPKFAVVPLVDANGGRGALMTMEGAVSW